MDTTGRLALPFHGENRGSIPLGRATEILKSLSKSLLRLIVAAGDFARRDVGLTLSHRVV